MGLLTTLIYLYVLGVRGARWVPLDPACTPVPVVYAVMPSSSTAMASSPADLTTTIIVSTTVPPTVVFYAVYKLYALSLNTTSAPLDRLTYLS